MNTILGNLECADIKDNNDGTSTIIFNVPEDFKQKYIEFYRLEKWSQEHFEKQVTEALENFINIHANIEKNSVDT